MSKITPIFTTFSKGELSPLLDGRTDVQVYYNGVKTLENFIVTPYGGVTKRPGTYYVAEVKDSARATRLIPFQFSITQAYILEFGDRYMRFYYNNGQLLSSGTAYEITTPYLEADLFDLQFAQDADTMWITHPNYKPRKLTRGAASFDSYTKMLLHLNGADAATTFTDSIGTHTPSANGTAQIDTAQYKFGGASLLLDGDSDYLQIADHADFNFGTGDFTIDFWIRLSSVAIDSSFISQYDDGTHFWRFLWNADTNRIYFYCDKGGNDSIEVRADFGASIDTWYHIELVRDAGSGTEDWYVFVNGNNLTTTVSRGGSAATPFAMPDSSSTLRIGYDEDSGAYMQGWMDEIRISKGIARHTANFTPPTSAYAAETITFSLNNYAPELLTLDVAPGVVWAADATITGVTSGATCVVVSQLTSTTYRVKNRSGTYTLGEVLTDGTNTADQGAAHPTLTGDPFGADASDNCPSCVAIFEQRLAFANSNNDPQKVWLSVAGDFEDMTTGANDADAMVYTIGSEQVNAIRWLAAGKVLMLGTLGGVFTLGSGSNYDALTPTNIVVKKESSFGSIGIIPKRIGNYVYYVQRNAKILREIGYSYEVDEYKANEITILSEHILGDSVVDMDYQQSPYDIIWCVRSDGEMATMTRQIDQNVGGWSRQITDGYFESVAVIPGDGGDDEVWVVVKRYINSSWVRYVEYFKPIKTSWTEQEDAFFVDSGLTLDSPRPITNITQADPGVVTATGHDFSNGDTVIIRGVVGMTEVNKTKFKVANVSGDTFEITDEDDNDVDTSDYTAYASGGEVRKCVSSLSGLDHLEGETIAILLDGATSINASVSSGAVTLSTSGGQVHAGLAFTPYLKPMRIEAGSEMGTAQSKVKRINKVVVRLHQSINCKIGNVTRQDEISFDDTELYTGDKSIPFQSGYDTDAYVVVTQDEPTPLTILAMIVYLSVNET